MPRKLQLESADGFAWHLIGIAADVAIIRLCYELNSILGISLNASSLPEKKEVPADTTSPPSLFLDSQNPTTLRPVEYYEDTETIPLREFTVFAPTKSRLPAQAKAYSFFLVVRSAINSPNLVPELLSQLNSVDIIRSAVDLSDLKNLKKSLL